MSEFLFAHASVLVLAPVLVLKYWCIGVGSCLLEYMCMLVLFFYA